MAIENTREFFAFLRKKGITAKNVYQKLDSWTTAQILDFAIDAYIHLLSPTTIPLLSHAMSSPRGRHLG